MFFLRFFDTTQGSDESFMEIKKILKAKLSQTEGCLPCLRAWVVFPTPSDAQGLLKKSVSFLEGETLLFQGNCCDVISLSRQQSGPVVLLKIIPMVSTSEVEACLVPLCKQADPLLEQSFLPHTALSETCSLVDYHRLERRVGLNSLLPEADSPRILSPLPHSLKRRYCRTPIEKISLTLSAEWVQKSHMTFDVGAALDRSGTLSSISGDLLESSWPKRGDRFGASWIRVRSSRLVEKASYESPLSDQKAILVQEYSPHLIVEWQWHQKRRDSLTLSLQSPSSTGRQLSLRYPLGRLCAENTLLPWSPDIYYRKGEGTSYNGDVFVCLQKNKGTKPGADDAQTLWKQVGSTQDVLSPNASSFFPTPRGQDVACHGLMRALTHMEYSHRCIEVRCTLPFEQGLDLHTFETVTVEDPHHGPFTGKVVSYTLTWLAERRLCDVVLEGAPPDIDIHLHQQWRHDLKKTLQEALAQEKTEESAPLFYDLIQHVQIENTAEEQIRQLQQSPEGSIKSTGLTIDFMPPPHRDLLEKKRHIRTMSWIGGGT